MITTSSTPAATIPTSVNVPILATTIPAKAHTIVRTYHTLSRLTVATNDAMIPATVNIIIAHVCGANTTYANPHASNAAAMFAIVPIVAQAA